MVLRRLLNASREPVTRLYPLTVFFAADGILFAAWVVRIPHIKAQVGATATQLGFALLCMTFASAISMYVAGRLCARLGTRLVTVASFPLVCVGLVLPALTRSPIQLGVVLFAWGCVYGTLLVALNAAAVEVEKATQRALMSPMHGLWSVGGLVGAVTGGMLVERLTTSTHLGVIAISGVVTTLLVAPSMMRPDSRSAGPGELTAATAPTTRHAPQPAFPAVRTLVILLGVVALCTAYGEGAVGDWAVLHLQQDVGASESLAAYGFGAYMVAVSVGRLTGGLIIQQVGESWVLIGGAVLAALGILVAAWTTSVWVAWVGLVVVGLGLANMFPVAMARAGALGGSRGVGLASTIGNVGMLGGPPIIGFLADQWGLPAALSTIAVLAGVAGLIGVALRERMAPRATVSPAKPDAAMLGT
ncbi:MFS transporter [Thermasporomyces composti]|uniref:Fucose permease n=1 Tax=Thermasporomyces composti TaxID=696763 RepID=A0A3D9VAM4_THECX|nr:MFS transporter [Thermasporomyces composti]REF37763.1 fucose permease [Thermasporomyces composti]